MKGIFIYDYFIRIYYNMDVKSLEFEIRSCVDVIRYCHPLTVKGKCHHERESDIES